MSLAHRLRPLWHKAVRAGIKKMPGMDVFAHITKSVLASFEYAGVGDYIKIHDDLKIYLRNDPNHEIKFGYLQYIKRGEFEVTTANLFRSILKPGSTVIDIGAAFGYFSLFGARLVGPTGHVYSFEPEPVGYTNICVNKALNNFNGIILAFNVALSDRKSTTPFYGGPSGGSIMRGTKETCHLSEAGTVQTVTLDEIMEPLGFPSIDLIKIDIEGGEINAFRGMRETLRRSPSVIILSELGPYMLASNGQSVKEFFDVLIESGFTRFFDITHETHTELDLERDIVRIERMQIGHPSLGIVEIMACRK